VVHIQYQAAAYAMQPAINFLPRRLKRLGSSRPRSVVTFHDLKVPYLFPKAGRVRRWVVNRLARDSDAAITTNQEDYEALAPILASRPSLIPIGSNIRPRLPAGYDRAEWRARWGAGSEDLLLCFFGFINDRKGVDTLLLALQRLVSDPEAGLQPRLLFIGGQTGASDPSNVAYLGQIQALIEQQGLGRYIRWTGFVPPQEVSASFAAADLCVLPFRDGVSFLHGTLHAALAHGMPILTTRPRIPLPELAHAENIYLVAREDPACLAEAIRTLGRLPELRQRLAAGARALAQEFRWERIAAQTLALYHTLLDPHRSEAN
jgi:glycosyltransferase involved in cell wall biosynthesis